MNKDQILEIVTRNIKTLVDTLPQNQKFEVSESTVLFGENSKIDSLSLVSVIVDLESSFSMEYGYDISLTDDRAMTRKISPFASVRSMVDYLDELINVK